MGGGTSLYFHFYFLSLVHSGFLDSTRSIKLSPENNHQNLMVPLKSIKGLKSFSILTKKGEHMTYEVKRKSEVHFPIATSSMQSSSRYVEIDMYMCQE